MLGSRCGGAAGLVGRRTPLWRGARRSRDGVRQRASTMAAHSAPMADAGRRVVHMPTPVPTPTQKPAHVPTLVPAPLQKPVQAPATQTTTASTPAKQMSVAAAAAAQPEAVADARPPSVFRRPLPVPPALASFESARGQELFTSGLLSGHMSCFFGLVGQFKTQDEPAFCGVTSLVMSLNAMNVDCERVWKGPWRWFHENTLNCCVPLEQVKQTGITLAEFAGLAECNGASVEEQRSGADLTLDEFRHSVVRASRSGAQERVLVLNYSRKEFAQTGDGHFSPLGGYCPQEDAILVLDVSRFKLPAHWVRLADMHRAMRRVDDSTGRPRGYVVLRPSRLSSSMLFTFRTHPHTWPVFERFFRDVAARLRCRTHLGASAAGPAACPNPGCTSAAAGDAHVRALRCFFKCMPAEVSHALTTYEDDYSFASLPHRPVDHQEAMRAIKEEIAHMRVFALTQQVLQEQGLPRQNALLSCALFLAYPDPARTFFGDEDCFRELQDLTHASALLRNEIATLRRQILFMMQSARRGPPTVPIERHAAARIPV